MRKLLLFCVMIFPVLGWAQTITCTGTLNLCPGATKTLTATGFTGGPGFQWVKDGAPIPSTNSPIYLATAAGSYEVIVTNGATSSTSPALVLTATTNPSPGYTNNNNGTCSGTVIQFTSSITDGTAPYTYSWNFNDATALSTIQNPTHVFAAIGCGGSTAFSPVLKVTDANGCTGLFTNTLTVLKAPDAQLADDNTNAPFNNCDNSPTPANPNYTLKVNNISTTNSCVSSYTLDWGDGTAPVTGLSMASFPLTHTYTQLGAFNLVITANGTAGCNNSKTYVVANQSNPAGGLGTQGSTTNLCAPAIVPFEISNNWQLNSPGTTYFLDFGDGTSTTLNHPLNGSLTTEIVNHTYTAASCPTTAYTAKLNVINACTTTPYTAGNIQIRIKPTAAFNAPTIGCANQGVSFSSAATLGYYGALCSTATTYAWDFGDPASGGNNTSASANPSHTFAAAGTYTVSLTVSNTCGNSTITHQICIVDPPNPTFTLNNNSGCTGLNVAATNTSNTLSNCGSVTYSWSVTYASAFCGTSSSWSFTNSTNASSVNPSFVFNNPGTYTVKLSITNSCGTVSATKSVDIKKPPSVSLASIANNCGTLTISPSATITNCGTTALTYAWAFSGGTPASSALAAPTNISFSSLGSNAIALTVTNECGSTSAQRIFTIGPTPDVTVPSPQVLCSGVATGGYNFTGSLGGTSFSWAIDKSVGLSPTSGTGNISNFTVTNATASAVVATVTVTPTNGCSGPPGSFTITVNPKPTAPVVTTPINYCQNATAAQLTATGANLMWYNNAALTGGSATAPTPSTAGGGSVTYYVTQNNGSCTGNASAIGVNVTAAVTNNVISSSQSICAGSQRTLQGSTPGGGAGAGTYAYQWQSSVDNGNNWTNIAAATSINYTTPSLTATTLYRRLVASGACSQLISNIVTLTVDAAIANTNITADQNLCQGATPVLLAGQDATGGSVSPTYTWESSADNTTWNPLGVSTRDYQPGIPAATTWFRRTTSAGTCTAVSSVKITVTPQINNNTIAADQTVCLNSTPAQLTAATLSGGTGAFTYQWQSSPDGTTWNNIAGATNSAYTPSGVVATTAYRRMVSSGFCTQKISNNVTVTVQPALGGTGFGSDQNICETNATPAPALLVGQSTTGGDGTTYQYTWQRSIDNSSWTNIPSGNTKDYQPPVVTGTTYYRRLVSSGTCNFVPNNSVKILVYNLPTPGTLSNSVVNTCYGSNLNFSTTGFVGAVKKWQYNFTPADINTWVDIASSASAAIVFNNVQQSFATRVVVMQEGGCGAETTSANIQVNVSAPTLPGTTAADATVCTGANSNTISLNGYTGSILRWETSTDNTNWSNVSNTTASINYLNLTATTWYRAVVKSGFCPQAVSSSAKITVVPNVTTSNAGVDQALCAQNIVTLNGNSPSFGTGAWTQSAGPTVTIVNPSLRNTQVTGLQTAQVYKFKWVISGPGACPASSDEVQVVNTPAITQAAAGNDQVICLFTGPKDSVTLTGNTLLNPSFETGAWSSVLPNPAGSSPLIREANNRSSQFIFDRAGTYRLTWTITNGACAATNDGVLINVFDKPVAGPLTASALIGCVGNDISISSGSTLKGDIYKWQYSFSPNSPLSWIDTAVVNPSILFANVQQSFDARMITRSKGIALGCSQADTTRIPIEIIPDFTNVIDTTELAVCPGQGISIAGQLPVGAYNVFKYQWQASTDGKTNWVDIAGQTAASLNLVPLATSYIRRMVLVSPCAKASSATYVYVRPSVGNFLISDSTGTCFPFDVTFTNLVLPSSLTIWNFGDGAFNEGDKVTHTYHSTGTFKVVMTAQYPGGCRFEATKNVVITGPKGILKYDHDQVCANVPLYFEVSSPGIDSVRWNFGDGQSMITTGQVNYHTYKQAGPYVPYVELLAGPGGACRTRLNGSDTLYIDQVKAGFKQSIVQYCAVTDVGFTDTSRAFYGVKSWAWEFGDGGISSGKNPVHGYHATNAWKIRQIVTGNSGCRDTAVKLLPLSVWDIPQIKTNKDSVACVGQVVPYEAFVSTVDGIKSTVWSFSSGNGATTLSAPKTYTFPGNYMAIFVATTNNNCSDTVRLPVTVYAKPSIDLGPDQVLSTGTKLKLKTTLTNGPASIWEWIPNTDLDCKTCAEPVATIKNDVSYVVKIATAHGCQASDTMNIKVFCEGAQVFIPNVFTPDNDNLNDVLMVRATGIRTVKSFRIFNRWGEVVFEKSNFTPNEKSNGWNGTVRGKKAPPDVYVYIYEVICENNVTYEGKGNITLIK